MGSQLVIARTNNVAITDDKNHFAFVIVLELGEQVKSLTKRGLSFCVT